VLDAIIVKELAEFYISALWVFGALTIWPLLRFAAKISAEKLRILKWGFWLQVFWLIASYGAIQYYRIAGYQDWSHSLMLPYVVGAISWIAVLVGLVEMGLQNKKRLNQGRSGNGI
jgi:hypothetical protein